MNNPGLVVGGGFFEREKVQENCGEWCYLEQPQCGKVYHFYTYYIGRCRIGNKQ